MIKGFTVHRAGLLRRLAGIPTEDVFSSRRNERYIMISAADGVTRDLRNGRPLAGDFAGLLQARFFYPRNPDPAQVAAKLFVGSGIRGMNFAIQMEEDKGRQEADEVDEPAMRFGFSFANHQIMDWQRRHIPHVDYLADDFPGCVGALGVVDIRRRAFCWGKICDAGAALFDNKGNLVMKTENDGPDKHNNYFWNTPLMKGLSWSDASARVNVRRVFRNNPYDTLYGEHTFGVLTGEKEAMTYVRTGVERFGQGYTAMVYTDGVEHILFEGGDVRGGVADILRTKNYRRLKRLCGREVRTEGTVVLACEG